MGVKKVEDLSELAVICVDIGKNAFLLEGFDASGALVLPAFFGDTRKL